MFLLIAASQLNDIFFSAVNVYVFAILQSSIICAGLVLLLISLRYLESDINSYPKIFVFSPLLIVICYPFLVDIPVFSSFIIGSVQLIGLVVLILLYFFYRQRMKRERLAYWGLGALGTAFILYWFVSDMSITANHAWPVFLSIGMIISTYSFQYLMKVQISKTSFK